MGLSQRELAERAGFGKSHLSRIESGLALPSPEALRSLAAALGAPADTAARWLEAVAAQSRTASIARLGEVIEVAEVLARRVDALTLQVSELAATVAALRARRDGNASH